MKYLKLYEQFMGWDPNRHQPEEDLRIGDWVYCDKDNELYQDIMFQLGKVVDKRRGDWPVYVKYILPEGRDFWLGFKYEHVKKYSSYREDVEAYIESLKYNL